MVPIDFVFRRIVAKGTLEVTDPGGRCHVFGDGTAPKVSIRVHDRWFAIKLAISPSMAIGEGYMYGRLTVENGGRIYDFLELLLRNVSDAGFPLINRFFMAMDTLFRRIQQFNPARRSQRNVCLLQGDHGSVDVYVLTAGELAEKIVCAMLLVIDAAHRMGELVRKDALVGSFRLLNTPPLKEGVGGHTLDNCFNRHDYLPISRARMAISVVLSTTLRLAS